jgi:hypothetical protein
MSVTPEEFSDLATRLIANPTEIDWRGAASRAYYAAYHISKAASSLCPDNSHFAIEGGTHAKLIDRFESWHHPDPEVRKKSKRIAYILRDMKKTREHADYDIVRTLLKAESETKIKQVPLLKKALQEIWP